jgi:hypothetical protein
MPIFAVVECAVGSKLSRVNSHSLPVGFGLRFECRRVVVHVVLSAHVVFFFSFCVDCVSH